jgi:FtsH-binding integral membrane protein
MNINKFLTVLIAIIVLMVIIKLVIWLLPVVFIGGVIIYLAYNIYTMIQKNKLKKKDIDSNFEEIQTTTKDEEFFDNIKNKKVVDVDYEDVNSK